MDKKLKAKWVAALRSGDYKQGNGVLRRETKDGVEFCCLGVLCDIEGATWKEPYDRTGASAAIGLALAEEPLETSSLSTYHLRNLGGNLYYLEGMLISLNDNGENFEAIATVIEEQII